MFKLVFALFSVFAEQIYSQRNVLIIIETFNECQGKDSSIDNWYSWILTQLSSGDCSQEDIEVKSNHLIQMKIGKLPNGNRSVSSLEQLAVSKWPVGAYIQIEGLFVATSGQLQGKFIFLKTITLIVDYIKKCSSVLGYSYISSKSVQMLISDNLDQNIVVSPYSAYELFKKGCTTVCKGNLFNV